MLDSLRGFASTWLGKLLGALLLVGLAGFGISGVLTGIGSNTVAKVGGQEITTRDFQRVYSGMLNNFTAQTGAVPTPEQAMAYGIPSAALNQLAGDAALTRLGQQFGLGVSDQRLGKIVRADPNFGSVLGAFDQDSFQRILQQNGYTQNEYFADQADQARRQQISIGLFGGVKAPKAALQMVNRYTTDTRTVDFFVINNTAIELPSVPDDGELQTYLTEHQAEYRTEPTRTATIMVLTPEAIAKRITITDEAIAADYERTKASYITPETRSITQVILSSDLLVTLFEDGKTAGKSFADLITETGLPTTDLGTLSEAEIRDNALKTAAFSLAEGDFTLITAAQGMRAISVSKINPGGQKELAEVHDQIAEKLQLRQARDSYVDILDQVEEFRAAFRPLADIAANFNLETQTVFLTSAGKALSAVPSIPETGYAKVASAIFDAEQGNLSPTVALGANLNVWFDLTGSEEARDKTLDEVREELRTKITNERNDAALSAEADKITTEIKSGTALGDAAAARNQFPQLSQAFGRNGDGSPVIDAAVASAAFSGGPGYVSAAKNTEGDYVIFQVVDIANSGVEPPAKTVDYLDQAFVESLYGSFVNGVRADAGMTINQTVLARTLGLDGSQ